MKPVSDKLLDAIRRSHRVTVRARVCEPGQTGTSPVGEEIPVYGGDVQLDASADVRATLDLTTDAKLWPTRAGDLLTPYGNELFVERGLQVAGDVEWVPLGYYRIETLDQGEHGGPVRVSCNDRMAKVAEASLINPEQVPAHRAYGNVIRQLVEPVYPYLEIDFDDDIEHAAIGRSLVAERDRHPFIAELLTAIGKTMWFDHAGRLRVASHADPEEDPVFTVNTGADGVLVSLSRQLTRSGVFNGVVAEGEGTDSQDPVRATVVDSGADSPTRWDGPFGRVVEFITSPAISRYSQAVAAAHARLLEVLGLPYSVDFTAVPNPALEPGDPILVEYPDSSEHHIIDSITVPLDPAGVITAKTRALTGVQILVEG